MLSGCIGELQLCNHQHHHQPKELPRSSPRVATIPTRHGILALAWAFAKKTDEEAILISFIFFRRCIVAIGRAARDSLFLNFLREKHEVSISNPSPSRTLIEATRPQLSTTSVQQFVQSRATGPWTQPQTEPKYPRLPVSFRARSFLQHDPSAPSRAATVTLEDLGGCAGVF